MHSSMTFFELKPEDVRAAIPDGEDWSSFTALVGRTALLVEIGDGYADLSLSKTDFISAEDDDDDDFDSRLGFRPHDLLSQAMAGPPTATKETRKQLMRLCVAPDFRPASADEAKQFVFALLDSSVGLRARKREAIVRMLITGAARKSRCDTRLVIAIHPRPGNESLSDFFVQYGLDHIIVRRNDGIEPLSDLVKGLRLAGISSYHSPTPLFQKRDIHAIRSEIDFSGHEWLAMETEVRRYAEEENIDFDDMTERLSSFLSSRLNQSGTKADRTA